MSEIYQGPKFNTVFSSREIPQNPKLQKLIYWCDVFQRCGLTPLHETGTSGNLSFRVKKGENSFIITGAGLKKKEMLVNSDFVVVEDCEIYKKKVTVRGTILPSSESMMHFAVYSSLPDVHAVFHGHHEGILRNAGKLGIPSTENMCDYGTIELITSILPLLPECRFFILKEHGFMSLGRTMDEAGNEALEIVKKSSLRQ